MRGKEREMGGGGERDGWCIEGGMCAGGERLGEIVGLKGERRGEGEGVRKGRRDCERGRVTEGAGER